MGEHVNQLADGLVHASARPIPPVLAGSAVSTGPRAERAQLVPEQHWADFIAVVGVNDGIADAMA